MLPSMSLRSVRPTGEHVQLHQGSHRRPVLQSGEHSIGPRTVITMGSQPGRISDAHQSPSFLSQHQAAGPLQPPTREPEVCA